MTATPLSISPFSSFSAVTLLGGVEVLHAQPVAVLDWIPLVRRGLPAASVEAITRLTRTAQSELARALAIPERTLARRKREGLLSADESAKLVRFARVVERAEGVFEGGAPALAWLKTDNPALGHATPLSLLDTDLGADSVMDTLGRIEQGVFA